MFVYNDPGRPGRLSAEETIKLKQLWVLLDRVVNPRDVSDEDRKRQFREIVGALVEHENLPNDSNPEASRKKKFGIFRSIKDSVMTETELDQMFDKARRFTDSFAMSKEELHNSLWDTVKSDHADALLLRFLRARKWNVLEAFEMALNALKWRCETFKVDELMASGELCAYANDDEDFLLAMQKGKSYLFGKDKEGRIVCYIHAHKHFKGEQSEESLNKYAVWMMETSRLLVRPPIDCGVMFFNLSKFGMRNIDNGPVKFIIHTFEAFYPESLATIIIFKAPWFFEGVWKIIKPWLDPVVASKVKFCRNLNDVLEYIDQSQIPKELGGDGDFDWDYSLPTDKDIEEYDARRNDKETIANLVATRNEIVKRLEDKTEEWLTSVKDDIIYKEREDIILELAQHYWKMDPYIRSPTYYDREGLMLNWA